MRKFSYAERAKTIEGLGQNEYDVIVIGGGITGTGIALDAVTRGMKTLLVEMQDFAAGTSSRSTKLVHGGLRYLKQFEVRMVAEVGKEREVVYVNAPHVTTPEWMLLPIYKNGTFGKYSTSLGLKVYDYLAGVRRSERRTMLSAKETLAKEPLLNKEGLLGGGYYVEYRTDDARLTIEVAKKAFEKGADLLTYVKVAGFHYGPQGKVSGVRLADQITGDDYSARGKKIVNAAGPWVEKVIGMDREIRNKSLQHTKGVHIVIDGADFPLVQPVYFDTPDGRMVFAIPRSGKVYVGTTDTVFGEDLVHPVATEEDKDYILKSIKFMFPGVNVTKTDIESSWAGVRPLIRQEGKGPSEISRKDEIWTSETGLITIAGGKLTGYRKMAETVTDMLSREFSKEGKTFKQSITKNLRLSGGEFNQPEEYKTYIAKRSRDIEKLGISPKDAQDIVSTFGTNAEKMLQLETELLPGGDLPKSIKLILHYSLTHEMVLTPVDYFMRRTGAILFDINWVYQWKKEIIDYMAEFFSWSPERKEQLTQELDAVLRQSEG